jgi:deoxyribodipyrimidine photo-lyase
MDQKYTHGLMWFRRDLRVEDNAALYQALKSCNHVYCVFIFDKAILDPLPRRDRRVEFIRESLVELDTSLQRLAQEAGHAKVRLIVLHGQASDCLQELANKLKINAVFYNRDDEPASIERDTRVQAEMQAAGIALHGFKDHLVFERQELLTLGGKPYTVFTPYKNAWVKKVDSYYLKPYPVERYSGRFGATPSAYSRGVPTLSDIGFEKTNLSEIKIPTGTSGAAVLLDDFLKRIDTYDHARDYPGVKGCSYLSVHLRFGTVSVRNLAATALARQQAGSAGAATWLSELIWRDFYAQILSNFPHVAGGAFKREYEQIQFEQGPQADAHFQAWCNGQTGYPLVDAAMAQINQTGYMHNRMRMVTASFLIKDLGIDWRLGERYFAEQLNDFELASNNGGWQWAASSGCDAQPYFRIFNPTSQSQKFDPDGKFIRRYVPALNKLPLPGLHAPWLAQPIELAAAGVELGKQYPRPVVLHDEARTRTLERYAVVKRRESVALESPDQAG